MKILITGGLGFQGSHLSQRLLKSGHEVIILNTYSEFSERKIKLFELEKAKVIWGSITDKNLLDKTVRDIDLVFHAAANIHVDISIKNPVSFFETNILGTVNILELCKERNIPFIHVSSCEVYGNQDNILTEKSPFRANSPYASSKAAIDTICYSYFKTYDMRINILRPANIFGPGQKFGVGGAVIPRFYEKIKNNENITIYGDGKQSREFLFINDLIDAYELVVNETMLTKKFKGNIYNIASGEIITIKDLAELMIYLMKSESKIEYKKGRLGEVKRFELNSELFRKQFWWKSKFNIKCGLEKYIQKEKEFENA